MVYFDDGDDVPIPFERDWIQRNIALVNPDRVVPSETIEDGPSFVAKAAVGFAPEGDVDRTHLRWSPYYLVSPANTW
jgi:hypothetical protein